LEHEQHPHHHPHGTGVRWLDIALGVAAAIVSLVSLWLGLHSAHSMEKLVAANSYPYLDLMRSTSSRTPVPGGTDRFKHVVEYELVNNGIGPARVEWVQLNFKGKPVADLTDLLDACCAGPAAEIVGINHRGGVSNALIRPGSSMVMFTWNEPDAPNPTFTALRAQMNSITYSACYCSVFDECYIRADDSSKPKPVEQCTAPAVSFRPAFHQK
jgi:hypothetical protein